MVEKLSPASYQNVPPKLRNDIKSKKKKNSFYVYCCCVQYICFQLIICIIYVMRARICQWYHMCFTRASLLYTSFECNQKIKKTNNSFVYIYIHMRKGIRTFVTY
jgi:hypothetical protein